jgi:hypothetical protein
MKVVAFMESPSKNIFPEGTSQVIIDRYRDDQEYHRKMLRQSMSGNRLHQAFGDLFDQIHWDNVAPAGTVDSKHVDKVVKEHDPVVILTFGNIAQDAVDNSIASLTKKVMVCHHPNARHKTQSDLDNFAMEVRTHLRNLKAKTFLDDVEEPDDFQ